LHNYFLIISLFFKFSSEHKFDSGTGWPSFYAPYNPNNVATKQDYALIYPRTEVHCAAV